MFSKSSPGQKNRRARDRVRGPGPHDLMAFNNRRNCWRSRSVARQTRGSGRADGFRGRNRLCGERVARMFEDPSRAARRNSARGYGKRFPGANSRKASVAFTSRFGSERPLAIIRSPGRINLMDATSTTRAVSSTSWPSTAKSHDRCPRQDTSSAWPTPTAAFSEQTFRISDLVSQLNWDDCSG